MNSSRWLFGGTVFLGAFLLFLVEPIAGKQLLPSLGGSAAVWLTCLVFFQTALLCAYLYAHWLAKSGAWTLHLGLLVVAGLAAITWALGGLALEIGSAHPVTAVFASLGLWIGLPFLVLGSTSPLLQVWWARLESQKIPYGLFALSNLASLLALALYPALLEPRLTLHLQRVVWAWGFCVFAVVSAMLTWKTRSRGGEAKEADSTDAENLPVTRLQQKILWVLLPMGAAIQLSAVTSYMTANIAAIPLLWVLPLGVYLLTIILAFEFPRLARRGLLARFLIVALGGLGYMLIHTNAAPPIRIGISFFLGELFFACFFLHAEAYKLRPQRKAETTLFYLLFAAGGALGSFLVAIVAPFVFRYNYDVAVAFLITALLCLVVTWVDGWSQQLAWSVACALLATLVIWIQIIEDRGTIAAVRNFYGSLCVREDHSYPGATVRSLTNGNILHGKQIFGTDALRKTPTSYYAADSGVGLAVRLCCQGRPRRIGVIGLGAGTIAAYGGPGDRIQYFEINPGVVPIAENIFTFVRESGAQVEIVEGDGRLSLAKQAPQQFDVLAVDAFSGDAIPLHLLTTQAVALYRKNLAPGGILAFHISNQHVDLEPPITMLAKASGMTAMRLTNNPNEKLGEFASTWILLTDNAAFFALPEVAAHAHAPEEKPGLRVWTDDYSSLAPLLRW